MERTKNNTVKKEVQYKIGGFPIALAKEILKLPDWDNVVTLYWLYRFISSCKKTTKIKSDDRQYMKKLRWGDKKFYDAKKSLVELGLISTIMGERVNGQFPKKYIKVSEFWEKREKLQPAKNGVSPQCSDLTTLSILGVMPQCSDSPAPVFNGTYNTFIKIKVHIYTIFENTFSKLLLEENKELKSTIEDYILFRHTKKYSLDVPLMKKLANLFLELGPPEAVISSMRQAIDKDWQGVVDVTVKKPSAKKQDKPPAQQPTKENDSFDVQGDKVFKNGKYLCLVEESDFIKRHRGSDYVSNKIVSKRINSKRSSNINTNKHT